MNDDFEALRQRWYNATVTSRRLVHDDLFVIRVRMDSGQLEFAPGQYTVLGLGPWERRIDGVALNWPPPEPVAKPLIRRAYSISCQVLNDQLELAPCGQTDELEFFIALVTRPSDTPPMLTPRLFLLQDGDRLHVGTRAHGEYTLEPVQPADAVVFLATGTGEAPHNAMIAELLSDGHTGPIVSAVCVRYESDLAYLDVHRELERRFSNYHYLTLTTRELWNLDASHSNFVGKQYIQQFLESGELESRARFTLDPQHTHVFLCGNPSMIGIPQATPNDHILYPEPPGVIEALVHRGFSLETAREPGNIHYEKYW